MKTKLLKALKVLFFIGLVLATVLGLVLAIENYRGKRAYEAYRQELAARGEPLDLLELLPPPAPDDQNFYKAPPLAPLSDWVQMPGGLWELRDTNAVEHLVKPAASLAPALAANTNSWRLGQRVDLAVLQAACRAETNTHDAALKALQARAPGPPAADLQFLLDQHAAFIDEVRAASQRPRAVATVHLEQGASALLPHLAKIKSLANVYRTRALVRLAQGDVKGAAEDILTCWRLARALREEAVLISTLVEFAVFDASLQPLWEGLARHQWQAPQLEAFAQALAQLNFVSDMAASLRRERASILLTMDQWRHGAVGSPEPGAETPFPMRFPSGWVYQNQRHIARMFQEYILPALDVTNAVVNVGELNRLVSQLDAELQSRSPYKIFARLLLPAVANAGTRAAAAQAGRNLALVAVALERYRLENGRYPEALGHLVPAFLAVVPSDPTNGEALKYRLQGDGYLLYSVGSNLKDDGGAVGVQLPKGGPSWREQGDWVWPTSPVTNTVVIPRRAN